MARKVQKGGRKKQKKKNVNHRHARAHTHIAHLHLEVTWHSGPESLSFPYYVLHFSVLYHSRKLNFPFLTFFLKNE